MVLNTDTILTGVIVNAVTIPILIGGMMKRIGTYGVIEKMREVYCYAAYRMDFLSCLSEQDARFFLSSCAIKTCFRAIGIR